MQCMMIDIAVCLLFTYRTLSFTQLLCNNLCSNLAVSDGACRLIIQEYTSENIDWTRVEFEDNQECLELIEKVNFHIGITANNFALGR